MAVLSDIHANLEALRAVLRDLGKSADLILNLGDLVGYNASPNECVDLVRDVGMHSIAGNHDQAACDPRLAAGFNIYAHRAVLWTREVLTGENTQFLASLAENSRFDFGLACHGTPESTTSYLGLHFQARALLKKMKNGSLGRGNVCLFGHTHKRKVWRMDVRGKVAPEEIPENGTIELLPEEFYLINPGSVGQPRSGDPRSSYLIFDTRENTVSFRLVEYDLAPTIGKIIAAGLPKFFARRLVDGV